jgi:hypothetical protein
LAAVCGFRLLLTDGRSPPYRFGGLSRHDPALVDGDDLPAIAEASEEPERIGEAAR